MVPAGARFVPPDSTPSVRCTMICILIWAEARTGRSCVAEGDKIIGAFGVLSLNVDCGEYTIRNTGKVEMSHVLCGNV